MKIKTLVASVMHMVPGAPKANPGGPANPGGLADPAAPKPKKGSKPPRDSLAAAFNKVRTPASYSVLGLYSKEVSGPTLPAIRGKAAPEKEVPALKPAKATKAAAEMRSKSNDAINKASESLLGVKPEVTGKGKPPGAGSATKTARATDAGVLDAVAGLFPPPLAAHVNGTDAAHRAQANALATTLLNDLKVAHPDEAKARDAALCVGMALRSVTDDPAAAQAMWNNLTSADDPTPASFKASRKLAANEVTFDAMFSTIVSKEHGQAAANPTDAAGKAALAGPREMLRTGLRASDKLIELGVVPAGNPLTNVSDIAKAATAIAAVAQPIGGTEAREVLAAQALLYTQRTSEGQVPTRAQTAAFVAWRNGYTESGPGSDFNKTVGRLHKLTTWINRAQEKPNALVHFAKGITTALLGFNKSPLSAAKTGLIGSENWHDGTQTNTLKNAQAKYETALTQGLDALDAALKAEVTNPATTASRMREVTEQIAMIEHWKDPAGGALRKNISLDKQQRGQVKANAVNTMNDLTLNAGLAKPGSSSVMKSKLNISTVEKWAKDAGVGNAVQGHLTDARNTAKGLSPKFSPEDGAKGLETLLKTAATHTVGTNFRQGSVLGADLSPNLGLKTPWASVSAGVGPVAKGTYANLATVRVGTNSAGSELYIATEKRLTGQIGVQARASGSLLSGLVSGQVGAALVGGKETSSGDAVSVRIPKGTAGAKKTLQNVVEFFSEQAATRKKGTQIDPAQLWENYSTKFVDQVEISVGDVDLGSSTKKLAGAGGVSARAGISAFSATIGATGGMEVSGAENGYSDKHGSQQADMKNTGLRPLASIGVGAGMRPIPALFQSKTSELTEVRLPNQGIFNYAFNLEMNGQIGQVRLALLDGKVSGKHTVAYSKFKNDKEYLHAIQDPGRRNFWINDMAKRMDNDKKGATALLDQYTASVANLPVASAAGNRTFVDRQRLTPAGAAEIDVLLAQKQFSDDPAEHTRLDHDIEAALKNQANWEPERLSVYEVDAHTVDKGVDAVLSAKTRTQVNSTLRFLTELIPEHAKPPAAAAAVKPPPEITPATIDFGPVPDLKFTAGGTEQDELKIEVQKPS